MRVLEGYPEMTGYKQKARIQELRDRIDRNTEKAMRLFDSNKRANEEIDRILARGKKRRK
jgi:hypothetical protein